MKDLGQEVYARIIADYGERGFIQNFRQALHSAGEN
jgi:hypothetical protein